jgi:hypothetical protein
MELKEAIKYGDVGRLYGIWKKLIYAFRGEPFRLRFQGSTS